MQQKVGTSQQAEEILGWKAKVSLEQGIANTLSWMLEHLEEKRILVIVTGQPRGSELAWKSLHKHFLVPFKAHLATYFTDAAKKTILDEMSQFAWTVPEYDDWSIVFDQASRLCNTEEHVRDWRQLCEVKDTY